MFLSSDPSPRWSALRGSAELRVYSSLPRHQDCSYPILNYPHYSSVPPPDSDTSENLPPLMNSLISPPPSSQQQSLQSEKSISEENDKPIIPPLQAHVPEQELPLSFRDRVNSSPLPMMTRQRRFSPNRDCVIQGTTNQEQYFSDGRFHPGERGRGFLNRNTKSESDHEYGVPITSTPLTDHMIHDGYSSSPTCRRKELLKHPKFGDVGYCSSKVVVHSRQYGDVRQSFSDDSSPTLTRNNTYVQLDEKRKSVTEHDSTKTSVVIEDQKRKSVIGHDDRKGSVTDEEPKLEQRGASVCLESMKLSSNNQSYVINSASDISRGDLAPVKPQRRHPLIRNSERTPMFSHNSRTISSLGRTDMYHSGSIAVEYSGNSDSGGEVMATPPMPSRRFGSVSSAGKRSDDRPLEESPGPGGSSPASIRASSGDDITDAEPLFRKVTIKKRRQETRRLLDGNGELTFI